MVTLSNEDKKTLLKRWALTQEEELKLHNLETKKYWIEKLIPKEWTKSKKTKDTKSIPIEWNMLNGITLYPWQRECIDSWLNHKRGTIKVVTGAGKTLLALAIIEKLQRIDKALCVAIVVPTVVLLQQWYEEILEKSNLPENAIGRLGAGYNDSFAGGHKKVLICVLDSAASKLPQIAEELEVNSLLLVIDECHRAGAPEMKQVFHTKRNYNLGLSATPERDFYDEQDISISSNNYNNCLLGREIGPIVYEMTLKEATEMNILPSFELRHYALPLTNKEWQKYDSLSHRIQELRSELEDSRKIKNIKIDFNKWCEIESKQKSELGAKAKSYKSKTYERSRLLYTAKARSDAVVNILKKELKENPNIRAILFHEDIDEVMELYYRLLNEKIKIVAENSELRENLRKKSIDLFRQGQAKVIVSALSLIEGFNVPSADIGIIVASSKSVRQRIQTLGRVLRKTYIDGKEKKAVVYILYMDKTSDEYIYEKTDWDKIIGADRNRYFRWNLHGEPEELDGPPRKPQTREDDIDGENLEEGEEYPGEYEGIEYSCDSRGNVFDATKKPAINPQNLPKKIYDTKKDYGRFKITPNKKFVLVLKKYLDSWKTYYVTTLEHDFIFQKELLFHQFEIPKFYPGDKFPHSMIDGTEEIVRFKQKSGRFVIAKKCRTGEIFALIGEKAEDKVKGNNAAFLIETLKKMSEKGIHLNKLLLAKENHIVYLEQGNYYFVATIKEGLEFPGK